MSISARTTSVDQTRDLAAALREVLRPGDVVVLCGDLGAGKTAFTQGLGRALGVTDRITSPTFTIAARYQGDDLALHHLDVYRLESAAEVVDLGLAELIDDRAITVIEWGDRIVPALHSDFLQVEIGFGGDDDERSFCVTGSGPSWTERSGRLTAALESWGDPC